MNVLPSENDGNRNAPLSSPGSSLAGIFRRGLVGVWALCSLLALLAAMFAWSATGPDIPAPPTTPAAAPPSDDWIRGTDGEKIALVSKHLRGFDMAMVETGHRYSELYWAGQDRNWDYAAYQLDKIRLTIELGIERRPKRAASANIFLTNAIPPMKQAIEKKDAVAFDAQFKMMTVSCNICHAMEKMPFVQIQPPEQRASPVRFKP
jgi:hypothetical protein